MLTTIERLAFLSVCQQIMRRPPDTIIGDVDNPYVHRWHLRERDDNANIYIHRFFRDDSDRALHDHRYDNVSYILEGSYYEWFHVEPLEIIDGVYRTHGTFRFEGEVITRKADVPHRISLIDGKPVTTMFVTGPKVRDWGFVTPKGWIPWKEFTDTSIGQGTYK